MERPPGRFNIHGHSPFPIGPEELKDSSVSCYHVYIIASRTICIILLHKVYRCKWCCNRSQCRIILNVVYVSISEKERQFITSAIKSSGCSWNFAKKYNDVTCFSRMEISYDWSTHLTVLNFVFIFIFCL